MTVGLEDLYEAADRASFLKEAEWAPPGGSVPVRIKVGFRAPDEPVLDGLGVSTDYAITYPVTALPDLVAEEHELTIYRYVTAYNACGDR